MNYAYSYNQLASIKMAVTSSSYIMSLKVASIVTTDLLLDSARKRDSYNWLVANS